MCLQYDIPIVKLDRFFDLCKKWLDRHEYCPCLRLHPCLKEMNAVSDFLGKMPVLYPKPSLPTER